MAPTAINPRAALTVTEQVEAELDYPGHTGQPVTLKPGEAIFYVNTEQGGLSTPMPDGTVRIIWKGQRLRVPTAKLVEYRPGGRTG